MAARKMFDIKPQVLKTPEQTYAELLGDKSENQIVDLRIDLIDEIENQPYKIHQDVVERIAASISVDGQMEPAIVVANPKQNGRYLLLAGRHRKRAVELNGGKTLKVIISQETSSKIQRRILLSTNNDRANDYSPSELAFAYKEQAELMKEEGAKNAISIVASENKTNRKSVHKLIRLTHLDKSLLHRVDKGEITIGAGYELSYLSSEDQKKIALELFNHKEEIHIDNKLARQLRENPDEVKTIIYPRAAENQSAKSIDKSTSTAPIITSKDELSQREINALGAALFTHKKELYVKIIKEFFSTNELCNYLKTTRYAGCTHSGVMVDGTSSGVRIVFFKDVPLPRKEYNLKAKEVDTICRKYLREAISKDEIAAIFLS